MKNEQFEKIVSDTLEDARNLLIKKGKEYAPEDEDRLHNFHAASELAGNKPRQALAGMMIKHTVSLYDMLREDELGSLEKWDEKLMDHLVYLILLRACVIEEDEGYAVEAENTDSKERLQIGKCNWCGQYLHDDEDVVRAVDSRGFRTMYHAECSKHAPVRKISADTLALRPRCDECGQLIEKTSDEVRHVDTKANKVKHFHLECFYSYLS